MNKFTITDFSGGILESNNPSDFKGSTWSKLKGFVPRNSYTMESQWPIQSIGDYAATWTGNSTELKSVYPLQSVMGVFLVALKEDGTLWWTKAPGINDDYTTANACTWAQLETCENYGWDLYDNETQPNKIKVTSNPDYRFISSMPFDLYKYTKKPDVYETEVAYFTTGFVHASGITTLTLTIGDIPNDIQTGDEVWVNQPGHTAQSGLKTILDSSDNTVTYASSGGDVTSTDAGVITTAQLRANNIDSDTLNTLNDAGQVVIDETTKGTVSGVLISSRRVYKDGEFDFINGITADTHQSLVAYVDSKTSTVKVVSFPNIRRWPQYKVNDEIIVSYQIGSYSSGFTSITINTQDYHNIRKGMKTKLKLSGLNGTVKVTSVPAGNTSFVVAFPGKKKSTGLVTANGTAEVLGATYKSIIPFIATDKKSAGVESTFLSKFPAQDDGTTYTVTHKFLDGTTGLARLTLSTSPTDIAIGDSIYLSSIGTPFDNGNYIVKNVDLAAKTVEFSRYLATFIYTSGIDTSATGTIQKKKTTGYPRAENFGHPYTWLDGDSQLHPGTGFIPRGNVGTMWGSHLIIGDIEYREDAASTAHSSKKLKPSPNNALLGTSANDDILRDDNTASNRSSFYYSDNQIDEFNPISVLKGGGTDTRIVGMHQLANRLIVITTSGGENDGVIVFSGLLSLLHPYNPGTVANSLAIRRQVIKGGIGPADFKDDEHWDVTPTCLWQDANMVCFIDKRGGIYGTDGNSVQRIDNFGPRNPRGSHPSDWVAATGKNLLVWNQTNYSAETGANSARLLCFTLVSSDGGSASGAWTELLGPAVLDGNGNYLIYNLKSVYGCGSEFYGVVTYYANVGGLQGEIVGSRLIRFAIGGPENEKGKSDGNELILSVATPPIGDSDSFAKTAWNKTGLTFFTQTGAKLVGSITKGASALEEQILVNNESSVSVNNFPKWTDIKVDGSGNLLPRSFVKGFHSVVFPAGIGSTPVISTEWLLMGDVRLESASVWYAGSVKNLGEDVLSEQ